jgi:hypothetical protein
MNDKKNRGETIKLRNYFFLHASLLLYSIGSVFSKLASQEDFLSLGFIFFYGLFLMVLFVYALLWQQILKRFPLTVAFANKAITILWGIVMGLSHFWRTAALRNAVRINNHCFRNLFGGE